jgi:hypothetical protein
VADPSVVSLRYRLQAADTVEFQNPAPIERETGAFQLRLEDGVATARLKEHHSSPDSARLVVEKYLRLWELYAALQYGGSPDVSFEYESAQVREPPQPPAGAPQVVKLSAATASLSAAGATVRTMKTSYPSPPDDFALSDDVEVMWTRYEGYLQGREPLLPMAYFCLTRFRSGAGHNKEAASRYRVSKKVLIKLGRLASTSGDETTARKWDSGPPPRPLYDTEKEWVENAVRLLICRAGQYASDPDREWPMITMKDLPQL